ncbi:MAG: hypothetical protein LBQ88_10360 [Treponema sp.]|jgi:hypothetical protein|nr:hypothetical protein [Treponema sp.]
MINSLMIKRWYVNLFSQGNGVYFFQFSLDRKKSFRHTIPTMTEPGHNVLNNADNFSHFKVNLPELGTVLALSLSLSLSGTNV